MTGHGHGSQSSTVPTAKLRSATCAPSYSIVWQESCAVSKHQFVHVVVALGRGVSEIPRLRVQRTLLHHSDVDGMLRNAKVATESTGFFQALSLKAMFLLSILPQLGLSA